MAHYTNNSFVDIHSHILYDVDDGARDLDESVNMLNIALKEGMLAIIATPHFGMKNIEYDFDKIKEHQKILNSKLKKAGAKLRIYLGSEIYWNPGVIEELRFGSVPTMAGTKYVLVEFNIKSDFYEIINAVHMLVSEGYRPIIAHLERYLNLRDNIESVRRIVDQGAYIQVNTGSFLRNRRDRRGRWARRLLEEDLIHFVATDSHNSHTRKPVVKDALIEMEKIVGEDRVDKIVRGNILSLIRNQYI